MANFHRIGAAGLNWSNVGSWSATNGGASNGLAQPASGDAVFFNAGSPNTVTITGSAVGSSLALNRSITITLNGGTLSIGGSLTNSSSGLTLTVNKTASETVTFGGGFDIQTSGSLAGTAEVIVTGGTILTRTGASVSTPLTLNGSITVSALTPFRYSTSTLKNLGGGTVTTTGSTLSLIASCTTDTGGVTWNTITAGSLTITINSLLECSTMSLSGNTTFAGTSGFTCGTLTHSGISAFTVSFKEGVTYRYNSNFNCFLSRVGSIILFTSSHATQRATFHMVNPSNCNILASFTRIDASPGRSILTFNGTITDCINIVERHDSVTMVG